MATIDVRDARGTVVPLEKPLPPGRVAATLSRPVALSVEDNALLQSIASPPAIFVNRSGTIASGGVAQTLAAANAARRGLLIQNVSVTDLWVSAVGAAGATQPSTWLPSGSYLEFPAYGVPKTAISIYGATTGQPFTAMEW